MTRDHAPEAVKTSRRGYLDWLRGAATLLMIEAHTMDAWTRPADRQDWPYRAAIGVGGFAAPAFMFLAGVALALAATSRERRGATAAEAAAMARRRGWQIFGLAFLFRLQALVISGGEFPQALLKVDILNVLGLAMVMAGIVWAVVPGLTRRTLVLVAAAVPIGTMAPFLVGAAWLDSWPEWLQMYVRSAPGRSSFSLFPWPAYLLTGTAVGSWLASTDGAAEGRVTRRIGMVGLALMAGGALAALLPPLAGEAMSTTNSPSFFFVRLGVVLLAVPLARAWHERRAAAWSPVRELGVASLFVYWIHVEMAYGRPSDAIHRALTFWDAAAATLALTAVLYGLVRLKTSVTTWRAARPAGHGLTHP